MANQKSPEHGKHDEHHGPQEYGMGAIVSPPDPRDFTLADTLEKVPLLAAVAKEVRASVSPPYYIIPDRPPITDQDGTPMCIAYSSAADQNAEDHADFGAFFNFDEPKFFAQIGGTPDGASMRVALDRRLKVGYPVQGIAPKPGRHRITAYHKVNARTSDLKTAIRIAGGAIIVIPWFHSWFHPHKNGRLPEPDYEVGVHAFLTVGWNDAANSFKANQSWGTDWAKKGKFAFPMSFLGMALEVWQTTDA